MIAEVAAAHGVSPAQAILRWNLQKGVVVIPGSSDPGHIRKNAELQHVRPGVVPHRVVLHLAGGGPSDALSRLRGRAAYMSSLPTFQAPPTSSPTTR